MIKDVIIHKRGGTFRLRKACLCAIVVRMMSSKTTMSILSVRVSSDERAVLEAAAEQARTTLSDFVRRKALESAEAETCHRPLITIPAEDWEAFEAWVYRPAETLAPLVELVRRNPS